MKMKCRAKVERINRPTQAAFFNNLKVGDTVEFSVALNGVGGNGRGSYAVYIECVNLRTNESKFMSFNQIDRFMNGVFEFKEVQ